MPDAARLIRVLGSDKDYERLGAVTAMDRALRAGGRDWHDLADAVERGWQVRKSQAAALPQPWQIVVQTCLARGGSYLKAVELDFLRSMAHWPHKPSEKQRRWLDAIAAALGIEREAA